LRSRRKKKKRRGVGGYSGWKSITLKKRENNKPANKPQVGGGGLEKGINSILYKRAAIGAKGSVRSKRRAREIVG